MTRNHRTRRPQCHHRRLGLESLERRNLLAAYVVDDPGGNDPPGLTLDFAIDKANSDGGGTITFAYPMTINVTSMRGLTQLLAPGITIDGGNPGDVTIRNADDTPTPGYNWAFQILGKHCTIKNLKIEGFNYGISVYSSENTITGNVITNFRYFALDIGGSANVVESNVIGPAVTAGLNDTSSYSAKGILLHSDSQTTIGGPDEGDGNLVFGTAIGIAIDSARGSTIIGNIIGKPSADADIPGNRVGIQLSHGLEIVSATPTVDNVITRNVIAGNTDDGVLITDKTYGRGQRGPISENRVQGNWIGTDKTGLLDIGNGGVGVRISVQSASRQLIGNIVGRGRDDLLEPFDNDPFPNLIAFNREAAIADAADAATVIRANSIFANGPPTSESTNAYSYNPGIDVGPHGRTVNSSPGSQANTAHAGRNFPTSSLLQRKEQTKVVGTLTSQSNTSYTLDFYTNSTTSLQDVRQGKVYVGSKVVQTDDQGFAAFDVTFDVATTEDQSVTATATGPDGTSEFELMYTRPVLVLPGIFGDLPSSHDFGDWLTHRGYRPTGLIAEPLAHSYDDLFQTLENAGYKSGETLFAVNYDWRVSPGIYDGVRDGRVDGLTAASILDDLDKERFSSGVDYLAYWMLQAAAMFDEAYDQVPLESVDVISHSTGGLVARAYVQSDAYGADISNKVAGTVVADTGTTRLPTINNLVMIAVPNRGAPKAFNVLNNNWADNFVYKYIFGAVIDLVHDKLRAGDNVQGPNDAFGWADITLVDGSLNYQELIRRYVPTIFDLMTIDPFLRPDEGEPLVDANATEFRNSLLLDLNAANGMTALGAAVGQTTVICGTNVETVVETEKRTGIDPSHPFPLFPFDATFNHIPAPGEIWYLDSTGLAGDGTVPLSSCSASFRGNPGFRVEQPIEGAEHQSLPGSRKGQTDVLNALGFGWDAPLPSISTNLATSGMFSKETWTIILQLDPVGAVVSDDQGRQFGYMTDLGPILEVPRSMFLGDERVGLGIAFGDGTFPAKLNLTGMSDSEPYIVKVRGIDRGTPLGASSSGILPTGSVLEIPITSSGENPTPLDVVLGNLSVYENEPGSRVGIVSVVGQSTYPPYSYSVADGRFEIVGGQLQLKASVSLDFESEPTIRLSLTVHGSGVPTKSATKTFVVDVIDVNDPPTEIVVSNAFVKERLDGAMVGTLSVLDDDIGQSHTFQVSDARFIVIEGILSLRPGRFLDLASDSEITFEIKATDSGVPTQTLSQQIAVTVVPNSWPWRNDAVPLDVNDDAVVAPIDALLVINELNTPTLTGEEFRLPHIRPSMLGLPYLDSNGDGFCTAIDALLIINHLNNAQPEGERHGQLRAWEQLLGPIPPEGMAWSRETSQGRTPLHIAVSKKSERDATLFGSVTVDTDALHVFSDGEEWARKALLQEDLLDVIVDSRGKVKGRPGAPRRFLKSAELDEDLVRSTSLVRRN